MHSINPPDPPRKLGRLFVCRGPVEGHWTKCVYADSHAIAERVLERWRREFPDQVYALFCDGVRVEDETRRQVRLERERCIREAEYFLGLAEEARQESKFGEARYYRHCAQRFLDEAPQLSE